MGKEKQINQAITEAITVLSETYCPAQNFEDAAKRYTSDEIVGAVHQLTGKMMSNEVAYEIMQAEGYRYVVDETSSTIKYVWLLKYRNH